MLILKTEKYSHKTQQKSPLENQGDFLRDRQMINRIEALHKSD
jgi:hypothetical protein